MKPTADGVQIAEIILGKGNGQLEAVALFYQVSGVVFVGLRLQSLLRYGAAYRSRARWCWLSLSRCSKSFARRKCHVFEIWRSAISDFPSNFSLLVFPDGSSRKAQHCATSVAFGACFSGIRPSLGVFVCVSCVCSPPARRYFLLAVGVYNSLEPRTVFRVLDRSKVQHAFVWLSAALLCAVALALGWFEPVNDWSEVCTRVLCDFSSFCVF